MLRCHPITEEEKPLICDWRYPGEYALYDMPPYEDARRAQRGFASPDLVAFTFYDEDDLIGFTTLYEESEEVMIGIGVAPAFCGRGYGREMICMTCDLSEKLYPGKTLYLEVRSWNTRAIRCYEKAGFSVDGEAFTQTTGLGEGVFYRMRKVYPQGSCL